MVRKTLILFFIWLMTVPCINLTAQDVTTQTAKKKRIEEEIEFIDNQLKTTIAKQKASVQQLNLIQKKVNNRKMLVREADNNLKLLTSRIHDKEIEIANLKNELDTLEKYYSELIYNSYKNRDTKVWFMYLLSSESIGQGYRRFSYLKNLSQSVSEQAVKIEESRKQLIEEKENLNKLAQQAERVKQEREAEYRKLVEDEKKSRNVINTLSTSKTKYQKEIAQKRKEVEALDKEIERILSKAVKELEKDKTAVDHTLSGEFEKNKGKLPWPVKQGVITESFGQHDHPVYKNIKLPQNNGVNITTVKNADVYTVFNGVVKQILLMPGYNHCVLIQHGTYFTFYCKLSGVCVKSGQEVSTGQKIGTLAESENTSVIHFQIWNGMTRQDPEEWLK